MQRTNWSIGVINLVLAIPLYAAPEEPETPLEKEAPQLMQKIDSAEEQNIYRHRDIYAIAGKPETKIQLSFKLRPVLSFPVYFAYTQLMFWDVTKSSMPFQDINFNPELFYTHSFGLPYLEAASVGLEHRSNGKDGEFSRSYDRVFLEAESRVGSGAWRMHGTIRLYWLYDIDWENNPDIRKYVGLSSIKLSFEGITEALLPSRSELYVNLLPGGSLDFEKGHGAVECAIKYRFGLSDVMPYLMLQYYYGYMESMLKYNQLEKSYRIGLAF